MKRQSHKFILLSIFILTVLVSSCGMRKSVEHRPDLTDFNATPPKVLKHNDSLFSAGENYLTKIKYHQWELYIQGDPLERGLAAGALMDSLLYKQEHIFFDKIQDFVPSEKKQKRLRNFLKWYNRKLYKHVPEEYKAEIYGLSRYVPDTYNYIAPPYIRSLYLHGAHDIGHALIDLGQIGCTSTALWGDQTPDGKLIIGRNLDFYAGDEFAEEKELFKYLAASDIYITPYVNEAQITSGTLTYAMGSGCVVVSTPYWHAAELLTGNKGCLFDFKDENALAKVLNNLLDKPDLMHTIQKKAIAYGKDIIWPKIGQRYVELAEHLACEVTKPKPKKETDIDLLRLPVFSLGHIKRLTDDTGIIQHAKFGIPNLKEGYCLDDNSRALLMVCMAYKQKKSKLALDLMPVYLSYIHYMQNDNGTFRNFLSFNRNFLDEVGSEDSFGRTIWVLGYLMGHAPNDAYYQTARLVFFDASPNFEKLKSIRGIANTMIGISYYLKTNPDDEEMKMVLHRMANILVTNFEQNQSENWNWFESLLAYDNGILPLALLHASQILENIKVKEVAFESMSFLTTHTLKDGYLSVIGNRQWFVKNKERSIYAQQPIDAMAMVLMYHQAFVITGQREYLEKLFTSFMWFLGENDLRLSLYDFETKGCCDGFEDYGLNRNQGAESSLAYLISHLTVLQAYEESYHFRELNDLRDSINCTSSSGLKSAKMNRKNSD